MAKKAEGAFSKLKKKKKPEKRATPFRDIEKDGVTYSFLDEFLLCREQARLSYVEGWGGSGVSTPLDFGSAFHDCLEWVARGNSVKTIGRVVNQYRRNKIKYSPVKLRSDELKKLDLLVALVKVVFPEYHYYWSEYDRSIKYLYQEEAFEEWYTLPTGQQIKLRGRWDAVYTEKGSVWLMENKTKGQIDEEGILASLPHDLQTMMYSVVLQRRLGTPVAGVLYNVIRRPGQKIRKTESIRAFCERVRQEIVKNPKYYFMRWRVEFLPGDLEQWAAHSFHPILEEVVRWWDSIKSDPFDPWKSPLHFQNPSALFTRYGRCRYFDLLTRNSYTGLYRR